MDRARRSPNLYELRAQRYQEWGGPSDSTIATYFCSVTRAVTAAKQRWPQFATDETVRQEPSPRGAKSSARPTGRRTPFNALGRSQLELLRSVVERERRLIFGLRSEYGRSRAEALVNSLVARGLLERVGAGPAAEVTVPRAMRDAVRACVSSPTDRRSTASAAAQSAQQPAAPVQLGSS